MSVDAIAQGLVALAVAMQAAMDKGATDAALHLEHAAQRSTLYHDNSGATRAATVAYVRSYARDEQSQAVRAHARGASRNPRVFRRFAPDLPPAAPSGDEVAVVVLALMTPYAADLCTRNAGAQNVIRQVLADEGAAAWEKVCDRVREVLA